MAKITVEIPDEIVSQFESIEDVRRTMYEDFIMEQRQYGNLSLGEAAQLLGITYTEFFELLGKKGLSFINAAPDELRESYSSFQHLMEQIKK